MKKLALSAFAVALMAAAPAYAQSSFVMIIGKAPTASAAEDETTPASAEVLIERAVESTCVRPDLRAVKAMMEYRACAESVRAELALAQVAVR